MCKIPHYHFNCSIAKVLMRTYKQRGSKHYQGLCWFQVWKLPHNEERMAPVLVSNAPPTLTYKCNKLWIWKCIFFYPFRPSDHTEEKSEDAGLGRGRWSFSMTPTSQKSKLLNLHYHQQPKWLRTLKDERQLRKAIVARIEIKLTKNTPHKLF